MSQGYVPGRSLIFGQNLLRQHEIGNGQGQYDASLRSPQNDGSRQESILREGMTIRRNSEFKIS